MPTHLTAAKLPPLEIRAPYVPPFVREALARQSFNYSGPCKTIFHFVWLYGPADDPQKYNCIGVAGDGENGCYETFEWRHGQLKCSDCAYGSTATALLHVLASSASL